MLIWETTASEKQALEEIAAPSTGAAECLQRADGKAGLVLCSEGISPERVLARKATLLFQGGCNDPRAGPWIFAVGIWTPEDWLRIPFGVAACSAGLGVVGLLRPPQRLRSA